jgi:serine/threonine-protein kinase
MASLPTPPRLGLRVPLPRAPREGTESDDGLQPGDLLEGRYQIEDRLGEGGVGFVYRARQIKLHRRVAIKLLQSDTVGDEEMKPRFEREALTLAALSHPHIVSLTDYGTVRGRPYLVMELLEGRTLRELIDQEGALEPARALGLARQILLALAYAHELGIVHRDLKPANLLLQSLPCHEHLKVLDFGLVKFTKGSYLDRGVQLSRVGFTFGTPAYMSPEHAVGGEVDGRSDLYAVGVLLFELLTGEKPFDGELQDILRAHFQTPVPKLWERRPQLGGRVELQALVERAMGKEREERYDDAAQMIAAVDALLMGKGARGYDRTEQVAVVVRPSPIESFRVSAERLSVAAARKTRAALMRLRGSAGPMLTRVVRGLRQGASHSYVATLKAGKRSYTWLKPRALSATRKLADTARTAPDEIGARVRKTPGEGTKLALPASPTGELAAVPAEAELSASEPPAEPQPETPALESAPAASLEAPEVVSAEPPSQASALEAPAAAASEPPQAVRSEAPAVLHGDVSQVELSAGEPLSTPGDVRIGTRRPAKDVSSFAMDATLDAPAKGADPEKTLAESLPNQDPPSSR